MTHAAGRTVADRRGETIAESTVRIPFRSLLVSLLALAAGLGCSRNSGRATTGVGATVAPAGKMAQAGASVFANRLDAAKGIDNSAARDGAMSQVALDAAGAGNAEVTKGAVQLIGNSALHDEVAAKAALKLAKAGQGEAAHALARLIGNSSIQDEILWKLSKGVSGP